MSKISVPPPEPSWITIGAVNQSEHDHHYYLFHIDMGQPDKPFCFEESVGGGYYSGGGAICLSRSELESWTGDWRAHLTRAGCAWVIAIIEVSLDQPAIVADILRQSSHAKSVQPADR